MFRGGVGGVQGEGLGCCQGCFLEAGGHIPETPYIWRKSDVTALQFSLFLGSTLDTSGTPLGQFLSVPGIASGTLLWTQKSSRMFEP